MKNLLLLLIIANAATSCNKEKRYSKRLMEGGNWKVTDLIIDGTTSAAQDGVIAFTKTDIYKEVSTAIWKKSSNTSKIEWQFNDKGKSCTINYVQLCEECDGTLVDELDYAVYAISGKYKVTKDTKKCVLLESEVTIGNSGKKVKMRLDKK